MTTQPTPSPTSNIAHAPMRRLVAAAVGAAVLTSALTAAAVASLVAGTCTDAEAAPSLAGTEARVAAAPELPREWRWERPAVSFDSMYRSDR